MAGAATRAVPTAGPSAAARRGRLVAWVMAGAAAVVVVLGVWGFARYDRGAPAAQHLYRTLQLFVLESGDLEGELPWQLEAVRLIAPALAASSAALAVVLTSRRRIDRRRARARADHVVVCGLGDRGTAAALALRTAGRSVVAVERDDDGPGCARCRAAGIPVVIGDATDVDVLRAAAVERAAHLLVLTPRLGTEGDIALVAAELVAGRRGPPLVIHLEIDDPHLAALLRATELVEHHEHGWRLEELDLAGLGARAMLDAHPPWADGAPRAHVAVVGSGPLARRVVDELHVRWRRCGAPDELVVSQLDGPSALADGDGGRGSGGGSQAAPDVGTVYVVIDEEPAALAAALAALRWLPGAQVVVHLERARAIAELLEQDSPRLHGMSLRTAVLTPSALLDTTVERVARSLHDTYRHRPHDPGDPADVAWEVLPEALRASNRAQAEHLADKLRAVGCTLVPTGDGPADALTPDEVEALAEMEHERWVAERLGAHWTAGPRDAGRRTTPYLVPWDELDDSVRDADRDFVRALPDVVAGAGLALRRIRATPVPTRDPVER